MSIARNDCFAPGHGLMIRVLGGFGLRNTGVTDLAIIDFHIIDILVRNRMISKPKNKTLPKKRYLEIEVILRELANKTKISLAELDLYLWYMETGKVLK